MTKVLYAAWLALNCYAGWRIYRYERVKHAWHRYAELRAQLLLLTVVGMVDEAKFIELVNLYDNPVHNKKFAAEIKQLETLLHRAAD